MQPFSFPAGFTPAEFRALVRDEQWTKPIPSPSEAVELLRNFRAYARMNLAVVPKAHAFDFLLFCQRNPQAFYISEATDPGDFFSRTLAPGADLRTDIPRYRVYLSGELVAEPNDIRDHWDEDSTAFLWGSSSTFDWALRGAAVDYRTLGAFQSTIPCRPAGVFHGPMVVTSRAFASWGDAVRAIQISSRFPAFHGAPVHMGDPAAIGISDLGAPEYPLGPVGIPIKDGEVVLYWGCGILGPETVGEPSISKFITHYPAHLLLTDKLGAEFSIL